MNLNILKKIIIFPLILIIKIYQLFISPILKANCRFAPTCSDYAIESLNNHGFIKGGYFALRRILSCHPLGRSGYDPVPKKIRKEI